MILPTHSESARNSAQTGLGMAKRFSRRSDGRSISGAARPVRFAARGVCQHNDPSPIGRPGIPNLRPPAFFSTSPVRLEQHSKVEDSSRQTTVDIGGLGEILPEASGAFINVMELLGLACVIIVSSDQHKGSMSCSAKNGFPSASFAPRLRLAAKPWASKLWLVAQLASAVQQLRVAAWEPVRSLVPQRTWHTANPTRALATKRLARLRFDRSGWRESSDNTPRSGFAAAGVFLCLSAVKCGDLA